MAQKEHKIGERFKDGNTLLETVKCEFCEGCFYCNNGCSNSEIQGPCGEFERTDEECVIFKEIKDMKEENSNKDEHFYIWGVPDRGEEVKELLKNKGINCTLEQNDYSDKNALIYVGDEDTIYICRGLEPSLCNLITSNWTELKLPWTPKDKELVWAWDDEECYKVLGIYCLEWNSIYETKCRMCCYSNYKHFEGEYPQWAKDALNKLEE
jgi:hypothetical protein